MLPVLVPFTTALPVKLTWALPACIIIGELFVALCKVPEIDAVPKCIAKGLPKVFPLLFIHYKLPVINALPVIIYKPKIPLDPPLAFAP